MKDMAPLLVGFILSARCVTVQRAEVTLSHEEFALVLDKIHLWSLSPGTG